MNYSLSYIVKKCYAIYHDINLHVPNFGDLRHSKTHNSQNQVVLFFQFIVYSAKRCSKCFTFFGRIVADYVDIPTAFPVISAQILKGDVNKNQSQ